MIEIVIGNVGSGKSYYATYRIWEEIKKIYEAEMKGEQYKYKVIYTNIEGIEENKYVKHLKVQDLLNVWKEELKFYKEWEKSHKNVDIKFEKLEDDPNRNFVDVFFTSLSRFINKDNPIKEYSDKRKKILDYIKINKISDTYIKHTRPIFEKKGYTNALFVIDEAHNFFKFLRPEGQRLVSYHRHYDQDYIFITQDLSQLHYMIRALALKTIRAVNPIIKVGNKFKYKVYSGGYVSKMDTNLLEKITLRADEYIFSLYDTGGKIKHQNYFLKVISIPALLVLITLGGFYYLINSYTHKTSNIPHVVKKTKTKKKVNKEKVKKKIIEEPYFPYSFEGVNNMVYVNNNHVPIITFLSKLKLKCKYKDLHIQKFLDGSFRINFKVKDKKCLDMFY